MYIENNLSDTEKLEFLNNISVWGSMDIEHAILTAKKVDIYPKNLADLVLEYAEELGVNLNKVDICYVIYDYILMEARSYIENETGKDILDYDIYTYGNCCCTMYDYDEDRKEMINKILKPYIKENKFAKFVYEN